MFRLDFFGRLYEVFKSFYWRAGSLRGFRDWFGGGPEGWGEVSRCAGVLF